MDSFDPPKEFDDYEIVQELGRGQMGRVYLAEDAVLARQVAIKLIAGVDPDLEARQRFLMEARAAARIQHPNVVSVYRVGELGERLYIVSELVRGKSLRDHAKPMPWPDALALAIDLSRGLAAAHRRGVVHCDLKPENAMLTHEGVPKLVDFGLARIVLEGEAEVEGSVSGTPDYMAPEVWAGRTPSRRSDVYSFGAMLFELVAGKPPFGNVDTRALGEAVREQTAPALQDLVRDVDLRLARVVARCLERDPSLRFASGEELREALEQISRASMIPAGENPYRGLRPFEASHRGVFFGRGLEISAVIERLRTDAIVIVTGDSGVGKSSMLRAGVIPAIVDGALGTGRQWETLTIVPGRRPLAALAAALGEPALAERFLDDPETMPRELQKRASDRSLLIFVDQMEELVTIAEPREAAAFETGLARISEGLPGVRLVATVRADFLSKIAALPRLGGELSRLLYFLSQLPPERIRDVITAPASATGVSFESDDLIATLVDATAAAGSGGLPLLSFALAELWEARDRDNSVITHAALDMMGGVAGALVRHADNVLAEMPGADRVHARRVLLRLVTSVGTRVRRTEAELSVGEGTRVALDAMVKGRLLVVHDGEEGATYELAHEVLVRSWGTLREWLAADADDRARREHVAAAAADWNHAGRRSDMTYRGQRLVESNALDVATLTVLERDFIAASLQQSRRRRWLRTGMIACVVASIAVVAVQRFVAQPSDAIAAPTPAPVEQPAISVAPAPPVLQPAAPREPSPPPPETAPPVASKTITQPRPRKVVVTKKAAATANVDERTAPISEVSAVVEETRVEPPKPKQPDFRLPVAPPPKAPTVGTLDATPSITHLDVHGSLPSSVVRRAVERALPTLRTCYRDAAKSRSQTPTVNLTVSFEVDENSAATKISARGASFGSLGGCARSAIGRVQTQQPPDVGTAQVVTVIAFQPTLVHR